MAQDPNKEKPKLRPQPKNILEGLKKFDKSKLEHTETIVRPNAFIVVRDNSGAGPDSAHKQDDEAKEYYDDNETLTKKVTKFVEILKKSKHVVFYSGAGISTAAKLPDYRGPSGVWTLLAKGYEPQYQITLEQAIPTYSHMAIVKLLEKKVIHYVVSTNVDGLHRRSGVTENQLAELHGNVYREYCNECGKEYLRTFDVTSTRKGDGSRTTGRLCQVEKCQGKLRDSIINFGENLPEKQLNEAIKHSKKADFVVVLGSSMRVTPACDLPKYSYKNGGKFSIVNLQKTNYDDDCTIIEDKNGKIQLRIFSKIDDFMQLVMKQLNIKVDKFEVDAMMKEITDEMKKIKIDPDHKIDEEQEQ